MNIPDSDYKRIADEIYSDSSPVGIDARKAHIMILYKLEQIEKRLGILESERDRKAKN